MFSKNRLNHWVTALSLFTVAATQMGCRSQAASPPETSPIKSPTYTVNFSPIIQPQTAKLTAPRDEKHYESMNSPLLKNTYKYCDPDKYASIVMDAITGEVLYGRNENTPRNPASMTKLMTLFLAFEKLQSGSRSPNSVLRANEHDVGLKNLRSMGLALGEEITYQDAMAGIVTHSANDFANMLAEDIGGNIETFVEMMNERALSLGMTNTRFTNPSGGPDKKMHTTAKDIAILLWSIQKYCQANLGIFKITDFPFHGLPHPNRILKTGADMGKTGWTDLSKRNTALSFTKGDSRLNVVVFGAESNAFRDKHAQDLAATGYDLWQKKAALNAVPKLATYQAETFRNLPQAEDVSRLPLVDPVSKAMMAQMDWGKNVAMTRWDISNVPTASNAPKAMMH